MKTKNLTLGLAFVFVIMAVLQTVQIAGMKNSINSGLFAGNAITGNAVASGASGGKIDMSGWTENEKMNYDHHGTLPARVQGTTASSSSGGKIDMSGWTENEKMNYDHHGTLPARLQGAKNSPNAQSAPTMVGGC